MNANTYFDEALFSVLKDCKTLPNFLDAVFGFLRRRTDFYCIAPDNKSPVGLPAGWAEQFVKQAFFKWKPPSIDENVPEPATEVVIDEDCHADANHEEHLETKSTSEIASNIQQSFTTSECYNGATYNNYTWSQNINDVDIFVKISKKVTSKDLCVAVHSQKISVTVKNSDTVLLEGELCQKIKHNDALWSLDNHKLEIHLDKAAEIWWDCLFQSEPKLDVSKIDCSRPFEDLPDEAQAKIEELTWNQERKRLGLPTSDELAMQKTLKKAWNAEGSPFKGPFDSSSVTIHT